MKFSITIDWLTFFLHKFLEHQTLRVALNATGGLTDGTFTEQIHICIPAKCFDSVFEPPKTL